MLRPSQLIICVPKRTHRVFLQNFLAELTEFATELSEFPLPKPYSRKSIPSVSHCSLLLFSVVDLLLLLLPFGISIFVFACGLNRFVIVQLQRGCCF